MCEQFGQTCADMKENTRILLKIYEERSLHLANLIHASNGIIVAALIGILTFAGSVKEIENKPYYITLVVVTVVFSLVFWRVYARWIDNEIVDVYGKILCCEYKLNIEPKTSLLFSLVKGQPDMKKKELFDLIESKQITKAYNEMFLLIEQGKVGTRGHGTLDTIATLLIIAALVIGAVMVFSIHPFNDSAIFGAIFGLLIGFLITLIILYRYLPLAKNQA